jgi:hypothetical protein
MPTASWGLVEVNECPSCSAPNVLYVNSLSNRMEAVWNYRNGETFNQMARCLECNLRHIVRLARSSNDPTPEILENITHLQENPPPPYAYDNPTCVMCERFILNTTDSHPNFRPVSAIMNNTTNERVIVHDYNYCRSVCEGCGNTYAGGHGRYYENHTTVRLTNIEGNLRCQTCVSTDLTERNLDLHDDFGTCNNCNTYEQHDNLHWFNDETYCENCYDSNVYRCDDCNYLCWEGNEHECESRRERSYLIHEYGYKPRPEFFGANPRTRLYFGLEIEVENTNTDKTLHDQASLVVEKLGARVYLKEDGSLNDGFEIVTHPHSLDAWQNDFQWGVFRSFRESGLRAWDTDTCGLHIHVSRNAFGKPYDYPTTRAESILSRQQHEVKFMKLFYDNERQICRIAGRSGSSYANFRDKGHLIDKVKWYDGMPNMESRGGRGAAINTQNENTLEVRVFKGSIQPHRLLSAIELVHAGVEYTRDLKILGSKNMVEVGGKMRSTALSWLAFSGYISSNVETYPHLTAMMIKLFDSDSANRVEAYDNPTDDERF